ncbi:hypothetical protein GCM10010191_18970 [Actinomadura vinacea]|uniref:Tetratricopeptide repeat protein n=1 Tax=Actinomadura vinacea TaxID=115336 RepID=A0ABN3IR10_9ACTN
MIIIDPAVAASHAPRGGESKAPPRSGGGDTETLRKSALWLAHTGRVEEAERLLREAVGTDDRLVRRSLTARESTSPAGLVMKSTWRPVR